MPTQASSIHHFWIDQFVRFERNDPHPVRPAGGYGKGDSTKANVLLIGLDGATWDALTPMLQAGYMPNLATLLAESSYSHLETDEAFSPVSWTSIATGKAKEKTFFAEDMNQTWQLQSRGIRAKRFWDILSEPKGKNLAIIDYYFTPTPQEYPEAILMESTSGIDHPSPNIRAWSGQKKPPFEKDKTNLWIAAALVEEGNLDVFTMIDREMDALQHERLLWFYMKHHPAFARLEPVDQSLVAAMVERGDDLFRHYQKVDALIGRVLDGCPDDYLFIASDHGFHTAPPAMEIIPNPEFLAKLGMAVQPPELMGNPSGNIEVTFNDERLEMRWQTRKREVPFLKDSRTNQAIPFQITWKEFSFHPKGPLSRLAASRIQRQLNRIIEQWNWDVPVFVVRRKGPSVTLSVADPFLQNLLRPAKPMGPIPVTIMQGFNGHNRMDAGIFIARGPGIARGRRLEMSSLFDIVPTMLYLKGKPVGKDMDGRVLREMIDPHVLKTRPISYVATYDDEAFLAARRNGYLRSLSPPERERLRSLGYLQ